MAVLRNKKGFTRKRDWVQQTAKITKKYDYLPKKLLSLQEKKQKNLASLADHGSLYKQQPKHQEMMIFLGEEDRFCCFFGTECNFFAEFTFIVR